MKQLQMSNSERSSDNSFALSSHFVLIIDRKQWILWARICFIWRLRSIMIHIFHLITFINNCWKTDESPRVFKWFKFPFSMTISILLHQWLVFEETHRVIAIISLFSVSCKLMLGIGLGVTWSNMNWILKQKQTIIFRETNLGFIASDSLRFDIISSYSFLGSVNERPFPQFADLCSPFAPIDVVWFLDSYSLHFLYDLSTSSLDS